MTHRARASGPLASAGFTLLEAVLALMILSGVVVAALGIRAQSIKVAHQLTAARGAQHDAQALFDLASAGLLGEPAAVEPESRTVIWRGEHLGHPYEMRSMPVELPSALPADQRAGLSDQIVMRRYTLSYRGTESQFLWHR